MRKVRITGPQEKAQEAFDFCQRNNYHIHISGTVQQNNEKEYFCITAYKIRDS